MRPLFDDAEKHHLAAGEPLLAHTKNLGNALRGVRTAASRKVAGIVTDTYRHPDTWRDEHSTNRGLGNSPREVDVTDEAPI